MGMISHDMIVGGKPPGQSSWAESAPLGVWPMRKAIPFWLSVSAALWAALIAAGWAALRAIGKA